MDGVRRRYPTPELSMMARIDRSGGSDACWPWDGKPGTHGYGQIRMEGTMKLAHVAVFERFVCPVPKTPRYKWTIDHTCRNRMCVNYHHLEIVTYKINNQRKNAALKTHCPAGHPYDRVRKRGDRECSICVNRRKREWYARRAR